MYTAGEKDLRAGRELEHLEVETDAFRVGIITLVNITEDEFSEKLTDKSSLQINDNGERDTLSDDTVFD